MSKRALLAAAVLLLGSCAAAPPPITEIALQRDCFGCPSSTELVLRSDGTATFSVIGSARHATADIVSRGAVRAADFDRLARLMVSAGFFALNDQYADPQMQDGKWTTIRAVRSGQEKKVFSRNAAAPPAFDQIESAIDEVRRSIPFALAGQR